MLTLLSTIALAQNCPFGGGLALSSGTILQSLAPGGTVCFDQVLSRGDDYTLNNLVVNGQYTVETCGEPDPSNNPPAYDSYIGVWTTGGIFVGESTGGNCGTGDDESVTFIATATSHIVQLRDEDCSTGFSGFHDLCVIYVAAPLPVELTFFEAAQVDGAILLHWQTATETNNEKFIIEHSRGGQNFKAIGAVAGNGTTTRQQDYTFKVEDLQNGVSYFRLKQIDFDGQFEYSKIISVKVDADRSEVPAINPNPSQSGQFNVRYSAPKEASIRIQLFNANGQIVAQQHHAVTAGSNDLTLDFSHLNAGVYFLKIGEAQGFMPQKVVIQ